MTDALLILNAGSSSLKFCIFTDGDPPELLVRGKIEELLTTPRFVATDANDQVLDQKQWPTNSRLGHSGAIEFLLKWGQQSQFKQQNLIAVGHRVVHGGTRFTEPIKIDDGILNELDALVPLAPLHQPHNIAAMRAVALHAPKLSQVACFDTSFHHNQPAIAQRFALPRRLSDEGIRRYGFHGLSYEYIASRLPAVDPTAARGRTIVAHLGNGASLCAIRNGASVATTMSFTPLDGLVMGTRCGSIDAGVLIYLMNRHGMDARTLERVLTNESGLLGVSEISSDMRTLLDRESTDSRAAEAIDLFVYRIGREIGSLAAALGGLDSIVFTGGIGERAMPIRARVCQATSWLGLEFDATANDLDGPQISSTGSKVSAWVIPTNEELMIAQHTRRLIGTKRS